MEIFTLTLDQLQLDQHAWIHAIEGEDAIVQRLYEMGLLEGEEVEVIGFAPLGDPIEIRLRDYRLSLRRKEAARIQVTLGLVNSNSSEAIQKLPAENNQWGLVEKSPTAITKRENESRHH